MTLINSVGLAAGILTTLAFLPQVFKTWKSRSAKEISLSWLVTGVLTKSGGWEIGEGK
jgi:MtN3 and saliva related transmembrane protein